MGPVLRPASPQLRRPHDGHRGAHAGQRPAAAAGRYGRHGLGRHAACPGSPRADLAEGPAPVDRPDRAVLHRSADLPRAESIRRAVQEQARAAGGQLRGQQERDRAGLRRPADRGSGDPGRPSRQRRVHQELQPVPGQQRQRRSRQVEGAAREGRPSERPPDQAPLLDDRSGAARRAGTAGEPRQGRVQREARAGDAGRLLRQVPAEHQHRQARRVGRRATRLDPRLVRQQRPLRRPAALLEPRERVERLRQLQQSGLQRLRREGADRKLASAWRRRTGRRRTPRS